MARLHRRGLGGAGRGPRWSSTARGTRCCRNHSFRGCFTTKYTNKATNERRWSRCPRARTRDVGMLGAGTDRPGCTRLDRCHRTHQQHRGTLGPHGRNTACSTAALTCRRRSHSRRRLELLHRRVDSNAAGCVVGERRGSRWILWQARNLGVVDWPRRCPFFSSIASGTVERVGGFDM